MVISVYCIARETIDFSPWGIIMNEPVIEIMKKEDIDEVANVYMKVFNLVGEHWTLEIARKHIESNFVGDCHFVAKIEDKIVGLIMGSPLAFERGFSLYVDAVAVLPDYQNDGIGSHLWEKMESYAKNNDYNTISLLANPKLKSFDWYKEMGYEESGWIEVSKKI